MMPVTAFIKDVLQCGVTHRDILDWLDGKPIQEEVKEFLQGYSRTRVNFVPEFSNYLRMQATHVLKNDVSPKKTPQSDRQRSVIQKQKLDSSRKKLFPENEERIPIKDAHFVEKTNGSELSNSSCDRDQSHWAERNGHWNVKKTSSYTSAAGSSRSDNSFDTSCSWSNSSKSFDNGAPLAHSTPATSRGRSEGRWRGGRRRNNQTVDLLDFIPNSEMAAGHAYSGSRGRGKKKKSGPRAPPREDSMDSKHHAFSIKDDFPSLGSSETTSDGSAIRTPLRDTSPNRRRGASCGSWGPSPPLSPWTPVTTKTSPLPAVDVTNDRESQGLVRHQTNGWGMTPERKTPNAWARPLSIEGRNGCGRSTGSQDHGTFRAKSLPPTSSPVATPPSGKLQTSSDSKQENWSCQAPISRMNSSDPLVLGSGIRHVQLQSGQNNHHKKIVEPITTQKPKPRRPLVYHPTERHGDSAPMDDSFSLCCKSESLQITRLDESSGLLSNDEGEKMGDKSSSTWLQDPEENARMKVMMERPIPKSGSPSKRICVGDSGDRKKSPIKVLQNSPNPAFIKADVTRVTYKEWLDLLIGLYSACLERHKFQSVSKELFFIVRLLTVQSKDEIIYEDPVTVDDENKNRFNTVHNCVYFAVGVLKGQQRLLRMLDDQALKLLGEHPRIRDFSPALSQQMLEAACQAEKVGMIFCDVLWREMTAAQISLEDEGNLPSSAHNHFKRIRDVLLRGRAEYTKNQMNAGWSLESINGDRIRRTLNSVTNPASHYAFGHFVIVEIMKCFKCPLSEDLQRPTALSEKLSSRVQASQPTNGDIKFFQEFLKVANNDMLKTHIRDILVAKLLELNAKEFSNGRRDEANARAELKLKENQVAFASNVLTAQILARFLGFITFLPYKDLSMVSQFDMNARNAAMHPVDLGGLVDAAVSSGWLVRTLPWVVEYLAQMDLAGLKTPYICSLLSKLRSLLGSIWDELKTSDFSSNRNLLLVVCLGWLFDRKSVPPSCFFVDEVKEKISLKQDTQEEHLVTKDMFNACCPFFAGGESFHHLLIGRQVMCTDDGETKIETMPWYSKRNTQPEEEHLDKKSSQELLMNSYMYSTKKHSLRVSSMVMMGAQILSENFRRGICIKFLHSAVAGSAEKLQELNRESKGPQVHLVALFAQTECECVKEDLLGKLKSEYLQDKAKTCLVHMLPHGQHEKETAFAVTVCFTLVEKFVRMWFKDYITNERYQQMLEDKESRLPKKMEKSCKIKVLQDTDSCSPSAKDTAMPAKDTAMAMPAKDTAMPAKDTAMSATAMPAKDTAMPAKDTAVHAKDTAMPAKDTAMHAKGTAMPAKDTATPAKDTAMPAKDTAIPATDTAMPAKDTASYITTVCKEYSSPAKINSVGPSGCDKSHGRADSSSDRQPATECEESDSAAVVQVHAISMQPEGGPQSTNVRESARLLKERGDILPERDDEATDFLMDFEGHRPSISPEEEQDKKDHKPMDLLRLTKLVKGYLLCGGDLKKDFNKDTIFALFKDVHDSLFLEDNQFELEAIFIRELLQTAALFVVYIPQGCCQEFADLIVDVIIKKTTDDHELYSKPKEEELQKVRYLQMQHQVEEALAEEAKKSDAEQWSQLLEENKMDELLALIEDCRERKLSERHTVENNVVKVKALAQESPLLLFFQCFFNNFKKSPVPRRSVKWLKALLTTLVDRKVDPDRLHLVLSKIQVVNKLTDNLGFRGALDLLSRFIEVEKKAHQ